MSHLGDPKYRADIDGLRAIAVLAVLGYHAFPHQIPGGFSGVDVFFVISGYLISSIILGGLAKGQFSFRGFYARRVKRIFPALTLVLAACCAAGWFTLMPAEYKQLGKHVAGGAGFLSNFILWREAGYFDTNAELKPLLHLWSLGIEEQFYIAWPLLLYLAWKKRTRLVWGMAALMAASFLFSVHETHRDVVAAFYSPFTRFWELTMGSALAYLTLFHGDRIERARGSRLAGYGAAAGLLAIGAGIVLLNTYSAFPGWWALLPTSGTVLLISTGPDTWISRKVLSNRTMVFIGLISFPLYLWHWPVLSFARIVGSGILSVGERVVALSGSLVLAALTYVLVERPVRFGANNFAKVVCLVALMSGVGYAGYFVYVEGGLTSRVPRLVPTPARIEQAKSAKLIAAYFSLNYDAGVDTRRGCWLPTDQGPEKYVPECVDEQTVDAKPKPLVLVWGDSHAGRLFAGVRRALGEEFRLAQFTRDNCAPMLDFGDGMCSQSNAFIMDKIRRTRPEVVILFAVWNSYGSWSADEECSKKLKLTISELKSAGVARVIVVGPAPRWTIDLPRNLLNIYQKDARHRLPLRTREGLVAGVQPLDAEMAKLFEAEEDVIYVSAFKEFCDEEGCLTRVNDEASGVTSWDYGHLTTAGAAYLARKLPVKQ